MDVSCFSVLKYIRRRPALRSTPFKTWLSSRSEIKTSQMLHSSTVSILRSVKSGSLLLAALLGTSLCAQAGTDTSSAKDAKDKNVIQQPMIEPKFWIDLAAGGEFDIHATKFLNDSGANFGTVAIAAREASSRATSNPRTTPRSSTVAWRPGYKVLPYLSVFVGVHLQPRGWSGHPARWSRRGPDGHLWTGRRRVQSVRQLR